MRIFAGFCCFIIAVLASSIDCCARDTRTPVPPKKPAELSCKIVSKKLNCVVGEAPEITVAIKNETQKDLYLAGSLDGSGSQMRYPHCYYKITGPDRKPLKTAMARCGNMNSLQKKNFVKVAAGKEFNPYGKNNFPCFMVNGRNFSTPGKYKIVFYYSTNEVGIKKWLGDGAFNWDKNPDRELSDLIDNTPKLTIKSNELVFTYSE